MDATVGGEAQLFYGGLASADLRIVGKRTLEWDPNAWKWDRDLFLASSLNPNPLNPQRRLFFPLETATPMPGVPSNSFSCSDELVSMTVDQGKHKRELDKRRWVIAEYDNLDQEPANLALNLGGRGYYPSKREVEVLDGTSGKKTKVVGTNSSRAICQVEDCGVDLSKAKDYHRRHKVCEMHSKASKAIVGNVMQRFCQQCSRFHALQEFDEGKRSCRRRLAGHNKRRRKTQTDPAANSSSLNDNQASGYLLMSILKILSNLHSSKTDHSGDQDLLSHLLRGLMTHNTLHGEKRISELLQEPQNFLNSEQELVTTLPSNGSQGKPISEQQNCTTSVTEIPRKVFHTQDTRVEDSQAVSSEEVGLTYHVQSSAFAYEESKRSSAGRSKINNFDLNDAYVDSDDGIEDLERSPLPVDIGTSNLECPSWMQQDSHQSSPPQTSGNSDSASAQSPSSSSGDTQGRTDRIVFKLFGKEPNNFPFGIRGQILDWLSHSPTDIESYIRPGCIILTIYLRMAESAWDELCCNLTSSLSKLLNVSDNSSFWTSGWIYVRVQNQIAFISNGHVVAETCLPFNSSNNSLILSVKPIAVSQSERAQFTVKGLNLSRSSTRLLCALEGSYLEQEPIELGKNVDNFKGHDELHCLRFSCSVPEHIGRGFLEVEDIGLSSSFYPFIVAEKDLCFEIRMLESEIELTEKDFLYGKNGKSETRSLALDFVHEMGWLLHRSELRSRFGHLDHDSCLFPFKRFKWLIQFSADHGWCAVVRKLLGFLLDGTIGAGEQPFLKSALLDMGLLHRAVRKNSKPLVELLLRYTPEKIAEELSSEYVSLGAGTSFLFRPDAVGPGGLTPLHVAAGRDGSEDVLDALTDDPGEVAIDAWRNARDSTGFTPEDYARLRGHYSYIHLVQRKIHKKVSSTEHLVIDVPGAFSSCSMNQKQHDIPTGSFDIAGSRVLKQNCRLCDQKLVYGNRNSSLLYRPAMLSMVAIAAVCVCVALLFKSSPEVLDVFRPFRWEMLDYGSI